MCRYACDLQPMLKVLAGHQHIHKLLNIHDSVIEIKDHLIKKFSFIFLLFKVDLSKLRYFYVDEMDANFVNKVDREQKQAHRRVSFLINRFDLITLRFEIDS